jgi:hypothetical protein
MYRQQGQLSAELGEELEGGVTKQGRREHHLQVARAKGFEIKS